MRLTPEQQESILEGKVGEVSRIDHELGEIRLVANDMIEEIRWGYRHRVTFWLMGQFLDDYTVRQGGYWQFDIDFGAGDSEYEVEEVECWQAEPHIETVTTYRKIGA